MIRLFIILLLLPAAQLLAQVGRILPVDEAKLDSTLIRFRERFISAVESNDTTFIWSVVDSAVFNGFGSDIGLASFKQDYVNPHRTLGEDLVKALSHGGIFVDNGQAFRAPYWPSLFPETLDVFEFGIVIGRSVNVREEPSQDSRVIRQLNYDIVRMPDWSWTRDPLGNRWFPVQLADSKKGFVSEQYLDSPIGFRIKLEKDQRGWRLTSWAAGD